MIKGGMVREVADDDTAGGADGADGADGGGSGGSGGGAAGAADVGDGARELELVLLVTCAGVLWCWCWC